MGQAIQHLIDRLTKLPKFRNGIFFQPYINQIILIDLLGLLCQLFQWFQRFAADKISNRCAEQRHHCRNAPPFAAKNRLCIVNLLRELHQKV